MQRVEGAAPAPNTMSAPPHHITSLWQERLSPEILPRLNATAARSPPSTAASRSSAERTKSARELQRRKSAKVASTQHEQVVRALF